MEQLFLWKLELELELDHRKLLKCKEEIDSLNLKTQQLGVDLHTFTLELKKQREIEQAVVSTEKTQNPEGTEVDFDLPPRFDEDHEEETTKKGVVEKTENPSKLHTHTPPHTFPDKLASCGVVEEFEPPLPQKESLHSQQELRTILFKEGENDVDFQGVHFLFPNSPSWESSSMQTHAWPYSFVTLLFEFHDKRHVMEFYLARKELDLSEDDGDPPWGH